MAELSLEEVGSVCQSCSKKSSSTRRRTIYAPEYKGSCGDSFCYRSCDMTACHPKSVTICEKCVPKYGKEQ